MIKGKIRPPWELNSKESRKPKMLVVHMMDGELEGLDNLQGGPSIDPETGIREYSKVSALVKIPAIKKLFETVKQQLETQGDVSPNLKKAYKLGKERTLPYVPTQDEQRKNALSKIEKMGEGGDTKLALIPTDLATFLYDLGYEPKTNTKTGLLEFGGRYDQYGKKRPLSDRIADIQRVQDRQPNVPIAVKTGKFGRVEPEFFGRETGPTPGEILGIMGGLVGGALTGGLGLTGYLPTMAGAGIGTFGGNIIGGSNLKKSLTSGAISAATAGAMKGISSLLPPLDYSPLNSVQNVSKEVSKSVVPVTGDKLSQAYMHAAKLNNAVPEVTKRLVSNPLEIEITKGILNPHAFDSLKNVASSVVPATVSMATTPSVNETMKQTKDLAKNEELDKKLGIESTSLWDKVEKVGKVAAGIGAVGSLVAPFLGGSNNHHSRQGNNGALGPQRPWGPVLMRHRHVNPDFYNRSPHEVEHGIVNKRAFIDEGPRYAKGGLVKAYNKGTLVRGPGKGQDDKIKTTVPNGAYIIDASSTSMLGDGSSTAGSEVLKQFEEHVKKKYPKQTRHLIEKEVSKNVKQVPVWLSDSEYKIDPVTVTLLGHGSNTKGAAILKQMVNKLRKHKSSKGHELPPKAKHPLQYITR